MASFFQSISPDFASPGDRFTVIIRGDSLTGTTAVSLGADVAILTFAVADDGEIRARIEVSFDAALGKRDLTITDLSGTNTFPSVFEIVQF